MVVDDTVTYRKIISGLLAEFPEAHVVGAAANGKIALQRIENDRPDLLLLDVEMPEMDGLEVLRRLRAAGSGVGAIMLSALTSRGAQTTLTALELGAFDFILKPAGGSMEENAGKLRQEIRPRLAAFARSRQVRQILRGGAAAPAARSPEPAPVQAAARSAPRSRPAVEVVAIGISTGGPKALSQMLPRLPAGLAVPLLVVQHMPPTFTRSLADDLNTRCNLRVYEAHDGQRAAPGQILIAPGGKQMRAERDSGGLVVRITDDPPENSCRPSVDYLFRSLAAACGAATVGVIMTGMGNDGSAGCSAIHDLGGFIIAQDEASCVVFGMPREPIERGIADVVLPLERIAAEIARQAGAARRLEPALS
jgi:two-component system chemotaxis response regulator CheB